MEVVRYDATRKIPWDDFVARSKNGFFMFSRDYMNYHMDRFSDWSLMFYEGTELLGVLPANRVGARLASHGGLTYGGLLLSPHVSASAVLAMFRALKVEARQEGIDEVLYKPVPSMYHRLPSQEDLYALFRVDAQLIRRDASSVIDLTGPRPAYTKGTKHNLGKARKANLRVDTSNDFASFMALLEEVLRTRHMVKPAHSAEEIARLAALFPENIRLHQITGDGELLGGIITYETDLVMHTQYIGISDRGRSLGALDVAVDHLLREACAGRRAFSFGISTTEQGRSLNEGLIRSKESFGARTTVLDWYLFSTAGDE